MKFAYYDDTGEIQKTYSGVEEDVAGNNDGEWHVQLVDESVSAETHYFKDHVVKAKQPLRGLSVGVLASQNDYEIVISGLPSNSHVVWPDGVRTTESGELTLVVNVPGDYRFHIWSVSTLPHTEVVHVEARH